jgi:hypothetical protein
MFKSILNKEGFDVNKIKIKITAHIIVFFSTIERAMCYVETALWWKYNKFKRSSE